MNVLKKTKMTLNQKIVITALMVSVGIVLQIVESLFNVFSVPGGKIGLANVATVVSIFILGGRNGVLVAFFRSFLGCFLYGGVPAMPYSISGAVLSAVVMWGIYRAFYPKVSQIGISVVGAFVHNLAQMTIAVIIFENINLFTYLPVLTIIGTIGGVVIGVGAKVFCRKTGLE